MLYEDVGWLLDHRGCCTANELEHLVGHLTFAFLFGVTVYRCSGRCTISFRGGTLHRCRFGPVFGRSCGLLGACSAYSAGGLMLLGIVMC